MKIYNTIQGVSLTIGLAIGLVLGYVLFSFVAKSEEPMVISGDHEMIMASGTPLSGESHTIVKTITTNPYIMGKVTSEKQFLYNMKAHHEAALVMAQQVLLIPTIHPEVKTLAKNIIDTQTTEIRSMRDYISAWKY